MSDNPNQPQQPQPQPQQGIPPAQQIPVELFQTGEFSIAIKCSSKSIKLMQNMMDSIEKWIDFIYLKNLDAEEKQKKDEQEKKRNDLAG